MSAIHQGDRTTAVNPSAGALPTPWYRKIKPIRWVAIVTVGIIAISCAANMSSTNSAPPAIQPTPGVASAAGVQETEPDVVAPQPVVINGAGNSVVQIGAILNGAFTVDYSFGSWCGQVEFLRADGEAGSRILENINDCSGDTNAPLAGSTIVHLENVTMVKTDNTRGNWSLTFTPLG